jgi:L-cysteine S-thiosulfotransferase
MIGSARSPLRFSAEMPHDARRRVLAGFLSLTFMASAAQPARAQETLRAFTIVNDTIAASLTGTQGDPGRGRAIVTDRQLGFCLLCHSGPFPDERFQGNLAPNLGGAGRRWTEGQLRLRMVDASRINPSTIMPAYYRTEGLERVAAAFRGRPILSAEQIEDVVAFLTTLRE